MIKTYVAFDLETTGLDVENDNIIEIGALKVCDGKVAERFMEFLKPDEPISPMITNITGITNEMVENAGKTDKIIRDFVDFCGENILVGHNIAFDYRFMKRYAVQYGYSFDKNGIDTLKIARKVHKNLESKSLGALCEYYKIVNQAAHRAYHDALATAKLYHMLAHYFEEKYASLFVPETLACKPKKVQPATQKQKDYLKALVLFHNLELPDDYQMLTRSRASKMIDKIILEHGNLKR